MGKVAFLLPGQGAQYPGMGQAICDTSGAARAVFEMADRIRPGTSHQCFSGTPEELMITANAQPCVFCADLAAAAALSEAGIEPDCLAGFSLGEVAALAFSGRVTHEEGFRLVCRRGELMQQASEQIEASMMAVLKLGDGAVEDICREFDGIYPVNYNCPGQLVVAGRKENFDAFAQRVREAGGRAMPLKVGGAFHSPLMDGAARQLGEELGGLSFSAGEVPLYSNRTAGLYGDAAELLAGQINSPVRWSEIIRDMAAHGVDTFVEAGPGKALSGFVSRILPDARVLNVEEPEGLRRTAREVLQC